MKTKIKFKDESPFPGNWKKGDIGLIDGYLINSGIPYAVVINIRTKDIILAELRYLEYVNSDEEKVLKEHNKNQSIKDNCYIGKYPEIFVEIDGKGLYFKNKPFFLRVAEMVKDFDEVTNTEYMNHTGKIISVITDNLDFETNELIQKIIINKYQDQNR